MFLPLSPFPDSYRQKGRNAEGAEHAEKMPSDVLSSSLRSQRSLHFNSFNPVKSFFCPQFSALSLILAYLRHPRLFIRVIP